MVKLGAIFLHALFCLSGWRDTLLAVIDSILLG